jgi:hypothetical protein
MWNAKGWCEGAHVAEGDMHSVRQLFAYLLRPWACLHGAAGMHTQGMLVAANPACRLGSASAGRFE